MRTRLIGVAGLALGLILLSGGAVGATSTVAPLSTYASAIAQGAGAGLDAGTSFRLAALPKAQTQPEAAACASQAADAAENPNDTDAVQDQSTAPDPAEADTGTDSAAAADADALECGDQTTPDGAGTAKVQGGTLLAAKVSGKALGVSAQQTTQETGAEAESAAETENAPGNDVAADGILCDQQGEHQGVNVGC